MRPIVPAPSTRTRSPIARPERRTACTATPNGSASDVTAWSTPAGAAKQWRAGIFTYSANPPGMVIPTTPTIGQR